uniref:Protein kinase domain-containing protein n=1 Tax=Elaeophora elaphi TaxID=1147741 RepID=A0A0R3RWD2_9BILA
MGTLMTVKTNARLLGSAEFGAIAVIGDDPSCQVATTFGFSATSSAAHMLGEFSKLMSLNHPHLCKYVEFIRSAVLGNAGFLISEHYSRSAVEELKEFKKLDVARIISLLVPVLSAFMYLHSRHITIGYFSLNSILLSSQNLVRLAHYGLHCISGSRRDVEYCINSWYLPPERFLHAKIKNGFICRAGDIWSFGIAVLELSIGCLLSEIWSPKQFYFILIALIRRKRSGSIFRLLLAEIQQKEPNIHIASNSTIMVILEKALCILPSQRPTARELLSIINDAGNRHSNLRVDYNVCDNENDGSSLGESTEHMRGLSFMKHFSELLESEETEAVQNLPVNEAFFLWKLCGSSIETIFLNHGIIKANPPVLALPYLVDGDCFMYGNAHIRKYEFTFDIFILPSNNFRDRMKSLKKSKFFISFEMEEKTRETYDLSLMVKEKDIEYQGRRMLILRRLLSSYPFKKSLLFCECCHDIPPLYRANLWSALLNIYWDVEKRFIAIDTFSPHASDRQLLVDIPRCHQYDDLMASPIAHRKLKRLLKAWLLLHENYVYWQGLDSLAAPFLVLNFTHLASAYSCLESFISLYLHDFFLRDNSCIVQEYLAVFFHLLAFMDAALYTHLSAMDFRPELFAIPWFLTCFAHILPLHKLFYVWDVLLLSDSSFPLFVGLAIMEQLRTGLITTHFNDAILLFSDLPDLNMERLVQYSLNYYNAVPASCTFRQYASKHVREEYAMTHYTVTELNEFCCPRISAADVIRLTECSSLLVIDVRPQYEYFRGAIIGSVNLPSYGEEDTLDTVKTALMNAQSAGHVVVIVDNEHLQRAKKISKLCVLEGYNRICILDGGVQKVRSMHDIFSIPS